MTTVFDKMDNSPGRASIAVTPSNTVDLVDVCRGFYVGGTGDVVVVNEDSTTCTYSACPVGLQVAVRFRRINSTGTTATLIVAQV